MSGTSLSSTFTLDVSNAIASMVMAGKATETEAERMKRVLKQVGQQMDYLVKATKDVSAANEGPKQGAANMERYAVASRQARVEANMLTQANRNLGYQITDIGTSLAGGMPWHLILIQQGGQIRDAYGGTAAAMRGILGLVTPVGVALAASAAAVGALATAFYQAHAEADKLNTSLIATGNASGMTRDRFRNVAGASTGGSSLGDSKEALQALISTGRIVPEVIGAATEASLRMQKVFGMSAEEVAKDFAKMRGDASGWAAEYNQHANFITAADYTRIRALQAAGKESEAQAEVMRLLNVQLKAQADLAGPLEKLWKDYRNWVSEFWAGLSAAVGPETIAQEVTKLTALVEHLKGLSKNSPAGAGDFGLKNAAAKLQMLRQAQDDEARNADESAARAAKNADDILKASRQYQDALATITRAGQERVFAELTNGMDRTEQAVKAAYASGITNGQQYRDAMYLIAKQRLADEITLAQQQVAIEAKRPVKTELETRAKEGAVAGAENKLIGLQGKGQKLDAEYLTGDVQTYRDLIAEINKYNAVSDEMAGTTRKLTENEKWRLDEMSKLDKAMSKMTLNEYEYARAKIISAEASRKHAEEISKSTEMEAEMQKLLANKGLVGDRRSMGDNMSIAVGKYFNSLPDEAKRAEVLVTKIFTRMEDAVINFVKTGKLSFTDLFSFIAEEYLRNAIRKTMKSTMTDEAGNFSLLSLWNAATSLFTPKANGMDYVPYNNYPAMLHEGERVLTRQDAANGAAYGKGENITISHGDLHVGQGVSRGEVAAALKIQQASTVELIRRRDRTGRWA